MDGWIVVSLGVLFLALGAAVFFWGRREMDAYYEAISRRIDMREFIERSPLRPEPEALKIGGLITAAVGAVVLVMGVIWL